MEIFNGPHLHLALNHFPVVGLVLSLLIALFAFILKLRTLKVLSFYLVLALGLTLWPVMETGEMAEDTIEEQWSRDEVFIEEHEEAAEKVVWAVALSGLIAFVGLGLSLNGRSIPTPFYLGFIASLGLSCLVLAWAANLGGQITHPEIRPAAEAGLGSPGVKSDNYGND